MIMKSIKQKLIIGILLILTIFLCGILIYGLTFKTYFKKERLLDMQKASIEVQNALKNSSSISYENVIPSISNKYNVEIKINNLTSKKTMFSTHKNGNGQGMGNHLNRFQVVESTTLENGMIEEIIHDRSTGVNFLSITSTINDFEITVQISINFIDDAAIKSVTLLLNIFIPITFIIILLTSIFAKKFTKPIIDITMKTAKISNLDFSDPIIVKTKDELGDLATSVNILSNKINTTLTELKNKNSKLITLIEDEKKNEELRREFISSISHELKSPIAVISGYAQILNEDLPLSRDDMSYYINIINDESERMSVIVNDLLDLYKFQSNTFKLNLKKVCIDELLEKIIKKNSLIFNKHQINLSIDFQKSYSFCDEIRIEQAIQNYINNAISHVDNNKIIHLSIKNIDNSILISVFNSGLNIPNTYIENIWNGFVRIDKVRNFKEKRVGLGLTIVAQICKLHNGTYGVINHCDGVEFWISLKSFK